MEVGGGSCRSRGIWCQLCPLWTLAAFIQILLTHLWSHFLLAFVCSETPLFFKQTIIIQTSLCCFLQADRATALTLWCRNMEASAVTRPRAVVSLKGRPSVSSVSPGTTSATRSPCPGVSTAGGSLPYPCASLSEVRTGSWRLIYIKNVCSTSVFQLF